MTELTDRQRFALRESLCDVLSGYSDGWSASSCDEEAVDDARNGTFGTQPCMLTVRMFRQLRGLAELLGEWPVGYRGEGGWEKVEL